MFIVFVMMITSMVYGIEMSVLSLCQLLIFIPYDMSYICVCAIFYIDSSVSDSIKV